MWSSLKIWYWVLCVVALNLLFWGQIQCLTRIEEVTCIFLKKACLTSFTLVEQFEVSEHHPMRFYLIDICTTACITACDMKFVTLHSAHHIRQTSCRIDWALLFCSSVWLWFCSYDGLFIEQPHPHCVRSRGCSHTVFAKESLLAIEQLICLSMNWCLIEYKGWFIVL